MRNKIKTCNLIVSNINDINDVFDYCANNKVYYCYFVCNLICIRSCGMHFFVFFFQPKTIDFQNWCKKVTRTEYNGRFIIRQGFLTYVRRFRVRTFQVYDLKLVGGSLSKKKKKNSCFRITLGIVFYFIFLLIFTTFFSPQATCSNNLIIADHRHELGLTIFVSVGMLVGIKLRKLEQ